MTEAGIVSTLKGLCEWSCHGGSSGARANATFISSNTGGVGGRSPGGYSGSGGVGGGGPGSWEWSGSTRYMHSGSGHSLLGLMRIDLLFKERGLLWIGWNMEKDMFEMFVLL